MIGAAIAIIALVIINVGTNVYWSNRIARLEARLGRDVRELSGEVADVRDLVLK